MDVNDVIKGLKDTVIHLAIFGYSEDKEQREKVEKMGECINAAIELLKGQEPVPPVLYRSDEFMKYYACGECAKPLCDVDLYCWGCGKKIGWEQVK